MIRNQHLFHLPWLHASAVSFCGVEFWELAGVDPLQREDSFMLGPHAAELIDSQAELFRG